RRRGRAGASRAFSGRPAAMTPYRTSPGFRPGYGARRPNYPGRPAYPGRYPHRPADNYGYGGVYTSTILPYGYGLGYGYGYGDLDFPYDDTGEDSGYQQQ